MIGAAKANNDMPIGQRSISWLMALVLLSQLPHYLHLPWWISICGATTVASFYLVNKPGTSGGLSPMMRSAILTLLSVLAAVSVYSYYGYFLGRDPCVAFLFLLTACKFAETRKTKDASLLICLCGFLLLTQYFYSQTALAAIISLPAVIILTGALQLISADSFYGAHGQTPNRAKAIAIVPVISTKNLLARNIRLLMHGLPIAALLFFLFPRLPGPLWSLPNDAVAQTGLSDSLSMGSISELSQSSAVAFRVEFEGDTPDSSDLYWRGPVLDTFDGRNWGMSRKASIMAEATFNEQQKLQADKSREFAKLNSSVLPALTNLTNPAQSTEPVIGAATQSSHAPIQYSVTMQANNQRWLFALENALTLPLNFAQQPSDSKYLAYMTEDRQLITQKPLTRITRYSVWSALRPHHSGPRSQMAADTQLAGRNTRALRLALDQRKAADSDEQYAQNILNWFREKPFFYTLSPPLLGDQPVDEFLFDKRKGFCEHYASSFTFLMRAAGIPARIVTGYQGGEQNGDYMIVRQSDAHAWVEAWINGRWQRYDPTAAVAPSRVELGFADSLDASEAIPRLSRRDNGWVRRARLKLDAFNHDWQRLVVDFNSESQVSLWRFAGFKLPTPLQLTLLVLAFAFVWCAAILGLKPAFLQRIPADERLWRRFCRKFALVGAPISPTEGPEAYVQRLTQLWPAQATLLNELSTCFSQLRYGNLSTTKQAELVRQAKTSLGNIGSLSASTTALQPINEGL